MLGYQLSASVSESAGGPEQARARLLFTVGAAQVQESTFPVSMTAPGGTQTLRRNVS